MRDTNELGLRTEDFRAAWPRVLSFMRTATEPSKESRNMMPMIGPS